MSVTRNVMLAANTQPNIDLISYPKLVAGKLDGLRGCIQRTELLSRSLKSSLNRHVTKELSHELFDGLDGELTVTGAKWNDFNHNQSVFMTQAGKPDFVFNVFDDMSYDGTAMERKEHAEMRVEHLKSIELPVEFCQQTLVHNPAEMRKMYEYYRSMGYEGLIAMDPMAKYKHGRSTLKQEIMLKLKPSEDSEATIIGMEELMHNLDAGNSKKKENLVPGGMMGKLKVCWNNKVFYVGTGFDHAQRQDMWDNMDKYLGKLAKFKFMELSEYGVPRSPVFLGIRSKDDL